MLQGGQINFILNGRKTDSLKNTIFEETSIYYSYIYITPYLVRQRKIVGDFNGTEIKIQI